MTKPQLLMTGPMLDIVQRQSDELFVVHKPWLAQDPKAVLDACLPDVEAIAAGYGGQLIDGALMDRCPKLRIISNFGVGYDSVDAKAAAARGIIVTNTPGVLTEETADTAFGLLLMTVRELSKAEAYLRAGKWPAANYPLTRNSLRDRSVGIVGLGRIGKAIARRCDASNVPVAYFGRRKQADVAYPHHGSVVDLARAVDTLIVVLPGGASTKNIIDAAVLEALGPRGILINVARGSVVDEDALIAALLNKSIAAAGLDVMVNEPNIDPRFLALDNVVLLPHVGSASVQTRDAMGQLVVDNLAAYAKRAAPPSPVDETPFKGW